MFKTNTLSFNSPVISTATRYSGGKVAINSATKSTWRLNNLGLQIEHLALVGVILFAILLVMHVVWINGYAAKGFELKRVQTAISDQTAKQKKLLVQQSLLSSTNSLAVAEQNHLVPVTEVEFLSNNNFAQAK